MKPLGMTQHKLAEALGVNVTRVNRIINGKSSITADTAMRLGRYFRYHASTLAEYADSV